MKIYRLGFVYTFKRENPAEGERHRRNEVLSVVSVSAADGTVVVGTKKKEREKKREEKSHWSLVIGFRHVSHRPEPE